ncbi:MAG: winged helix-turn-helix transcriptional regulator [Chloroflexota bacterium]|nr:winged helix-turn-helix transcriptional regulator [Chloroflexota bacterium]
MSGIWHYQVHLPLSYRVQESEHIFQLIRAGDSCSIIGVSGMAKSNLFRHLLNSEVRQHYLGGGWQSHLFLTIDSHALGELSERAMYDLLLNYLAKEAQQRGVAQEVLGQIQALHQETRSIAEGLAWQRVFSQAIQAIMTVEPVQHLVFLFDQFDEAYKTLAPRFFANLRSIRDTYKYRVSYVTFTRDELPHLCHAPECEEFYELLQPHILGLGPYNREDSWGELTRIASRYGVSPEHRLGDHLIRLTGGHPGLLKAAYMSTLHSDTNLPPSDEGASVVLLNNSDVTTECVKLWESLGEDEREVMRAVVRRIKPLPGADVLRRLRLKGLLTSADNLFSPLFADYIARLLASEPTLTKVQAGPLRIDMADEVWVGERKVEPRLTASELRLLAYFFGKVGQICTKDEINAVIHPEDYARGELMSEAAIEKQVDRLREHIEHDPRHPKFIVTMRGRGYMLKV